MLYATQLCNGTYFNKICSQCFCRNFHTISLVVGRNASCSTMREKS